MKKYDWYAVAAVVIAALFIWGIQRFELLETGTEITVSRGGTIIGTYSLSEEDRITFTDENGGINILVIHNGTAVMQEADCPDKLCTKQRAISGKGESIICLPHKLVVEVTKGEEPELDAVVQ